MITIKQFKTIISYLFLILLCGCGGEEKMLNKTGTSSSSAIAVRDYQTLVDKRIYFGHQSVGNNILDGLNDLLVEDPNIKMNVVKIDDANMSTTGTLMHSYIGINEDPISKLQAFSQLMNEKLGNNVEIAFLKFCFVDINAKTDVEKIFNYYKNTLDGLSKQYPDTKFIHVTVPLTTVQTDFKVWIKKVIGRPIGGYADNIKRNQFNEMLKREYGKDNMVFDLARIESTYPDGSRSSFIYNGQTYYALIPEYTDDGGHLNKEGRKFSAMGLLSFLSQVAER